MRVLGPVVVALLLSVAPGAVPSAEAATSTDWFGYHGDAVHSGYSAGTPTAGTPRVAWRARLDGVTQASPLVVGSRVVAATENDSVYALDRATGRALWKRHLATPVRSSSLPCGNIDPLGITGTPVFDPTTQRVFAVTVSLAGSHLRHTLFGLDVATGATEVHVVIDPPGQDPDVENQRGALALSRGRVLITYGGHAGDCGSYHGYLASVTTAGHSLGYYKVGTLGAAGMWQPSGASVDGAGYAYVVSGNGRATTGAWDGSNAVHVVDPVTLQRKDFFAESNWAQGNRDDTDLGSSGALLFQGRVWIEGKTSTGYVLDLHRLGGIGHPLQTVSGACNAQFGGAATHGNAVFAPCTNGVRQLRVQSDRTLALGWRAPSNVIGSPVVGGGAVWSLDPAGTLYELNETSGAVVHTVAVGPTVRFATSALSGALVLVPTKDGVTAVNGA